MGIPKRKQPVKTGIKPLQTKAESLTPLMVNKLVDSSQSVEGSQWNHWQTILTV
ncbi:MAG: hypothetical protein Q8N96_15085 [Methylovulum sp.]|nr:hypothetical protein [Methylovulum sp.]